MKEWNEFLIIAILISAICGCKQFENKQIGNSHSDTTSVRLARIMFYNCENLFDCINDTLTRDDDFLPDGNQHWTNDKFKRKLVNLSRVIMAVGQWSPPEIIGLCEIENRYVLSRLVYSTNLSRAGYKIIHKDSPDSRGIDVAMLYLPDRYKVTDTSWITISIKQNPDFKTRDILYTRGILLSGDILHVFVNHWPSRRGGEIQSEFLRIAVAEILRQKTDSILALDHQANIVIMGDFNDEPVNESILKILGASIDNNSNDTSHLINLSYQFYGKPATGTHKMGKEWAVLDQVIVSAALLNKLSGCFTIPNSVTIFNPPFLLQPETDGIGEKPYRTYSGPQYIGGFSDHLPVYIDILYKNSQ